MEPTPETLEHLRHEALVGWCRKAIADQLSNAERQREELQSTRSPFAVFSRREAKEAFTRALRSTEENTATLRHYQVQLDHIERLLAPLIRAGVAEYLWRASADYQQMMHCTRAIDGWLQRLHGLEDPLVAFARELRESRAARTGAPYLRTLANARTYALKLDAEHGALAAVAREVDGILALSHSPLRLPELPELKRTTWIQRVASLTPALAQIELAQVETVIREFLAQGVPAAAATARSCRESCQALADHYLSDYWNQLRDFARTHWIEETTLEAAMQMLVEVYIDADLVRRQHEIAYDPFNNFKL